MTVDDKTGIAAPEGTATTLVRGASDPGEPELALPRLERPARIAPGTEEVVQDGAPREARVEEEAPIPELSVPIEGEEEEELPLAPEGF